MSHDYPQDTKNPYTTATPPSYAPPPGAAPATQPGGYFPQGPPQGPPQGHAQGPSAGDPHAAGAPQQYPQQGYSPPQQGYSPPPQQAYAQSPGVQPAPYAAPGQPQHPLAFSPVHQQLMSPVQQAMYAQPVMAGGMVGGRPQTLHAYPAPCLCPNCGQTQVTRVHYEAGSYTHIWAIILGVVACCCCIPYLIDGLKDVHHNCGNCGIPLAVFHRNGGVEVLAHQGQAVTPMAAPQGIPMQPTGGHPGQPMQPQYTGPPKPQ